MIPDIPSLKLTAQAPENGCLEYFLVSFWGKRPIFQVRLLLVSGRDTWSRIIPGLVSGLCIQIHTKILQTFLFFQKNPNFDPPIFPRLGSASGTHRPSHQRRMAMSTSRVQRGVLRRVATQMVTPLVCFFLIHLGRLTAGSYSHDPWKENDLNQTSRELCSILIFRGVYKRCSISLGGKLRSYIFWWVHVC